MSFFPAERLTKDGQAGVSLNLKSCAMDGEHLNI